jgi:hypothetical protein
VATHTHERENYRINDLIGPKLDALASKAPIMAGLGLVLTVVGLALAIGAKNPRIFFESYLVAFMFWFGITLGAQFALMGHHVTGGGWGFLARRPLEAATRNWPIVIAMWVPIFVACLLSSSNGHAGLYEWADKNILLHDEALSKKIGYLNIPAWTIRSLICFAIWFVFSYYLNKMSREEDASDNPWVRHRLTNMSAFGLIVYLCTVTVASIDWVMTIEPHWASALYGAIFLVGQAHSTLCMLVLCFAYFGRDLPLFKKVEHRYFRDIGNLMLAFTLLWAYTNYSQYMIMYSGNMHEEAEWHIHRTSHMWQMVGFVNICAHFALPFLFLIMSLTKVNINNLAKLATFLIFARFLDLAYYVLPTFSDRKTPFTAMPASIFTDLGLPLLLGGIWLWAWANQMRKENALVVPQYDPRLEGHWPLPELANGNGNGNGNGAVAVKEVPAHG